jgi:hypothetical protein
MGETLWLFSFKTKMTYLKEWSILKMRAFRRSNTLQSERKSRKWKDNNRAADDRLSRKSKERKRRKKQREGFPVGFLGPRGGGGGGRGGDARRARAPRGQVPSALPPFPFSPSLPPEGGRTPTQLAESCIDRFQDFKFPLFHHRLFMERMSRLENAFSYSKDLHWSQNNLSF